MTFYKSLTNIAVLSLVERFVKGRNFLVDIVRSQWRKGFYFSQVHLLSCRCTVWSNILLFFQPITAQLSNLNFLACPVISWKMNRSRTAVRWRNTKNVVRGFTLICFNSSLQAWSADSWEGKIPRNTFFRIHQVLSDLYRLYWWLMFTYKTRKITRTLKFKHHSL